MEGGKKMNKQAELKKISGQVILNLKFSFKFNINKKSKANLEYFVPKTTTPISRLIKK